MPPCVPALSALGQAGTPEAVRPLDGEVLTDLCMLLWVQVGLDKDIGFTLSCPVPVDDLASELRDIGIMQLVMRLFQSGSLLRAGVKWWIKVWFFLRRKHLDDLLCGSEGISPYCPDLHHLTGQLWCQVW